MYAVHFLGLFVMIQSTFLGLSSRIFVSFSAGTSLPALCMDKNFNVPICIYKISKQHEHNTPQGIDIQT